ncbi:TPA: SHOCT domain-containing protein [Clostridium sporogenes]
MEVQKIENFKIPNAVAHEITQDELQREFDYYRAQKVLETMFLFGMISVDEFNKISERNRQTFSPYLSEIMP